MSVSPMLTVDDRAAREKKAVALSSVGAAALVTVLKAIVGFLTGSLGILSDAAHSGLDLMAALLTYFSVSISDRPADVTHPYGHGKVENLSAFVELIVVAGTSIWIGAEAVKRLSFQPVRVRPSIWAFLVMGVSMVVDALRSKALARVARQHHSQALEADALHFSADLFSSGTVVLGLALVWIAEQTHTVWLQRADPLAALCVAGVVVWISVRLGRRTVDALVDAAPQGVEKSIEQAIAEVGEVVHRDRIRVRQSGNQLFVDLRLTLAGDIPLEHAESVIRLVESRVREVFPMADVVVHAAPQPPRSEDIVEKIRSIARRGNFQTHDVAAYELRDRINVSLDLEVDPALTLQAAHDQATRLEEEIKRELTMVEEVNIHLEPLPRGVPRGGEAPLDLEAMKRELLEIARQTPGLLDCHSVEAHQVSGNILVGLHCTLAAELPIARVHDVTEDLKFRLREAFPRISKISIHAEPRAKE